MTTSSFVIGKRYINEAGYLLSTILFVVFHFIFIFSCHSLSRPIGRPTSCGKCERIQVGFYFGSMDFGGKRNHFIDHLPRFQYTLSTNDVSIQESYKKRPDITLFIASFLLKSSVEVWSSKLFCFHIFYGDKGAPKRCMVS